MESSPWPNEGSDDASSPAAFQQPSHLSLSGQVNSFDGGAAQQMPTMLYVQPPSGAAKIMGILIVIYGAFGLLASVGGIAGASVLEGFLADVPEGDLPFNSEKMASYLFVSSLLGIVTAVPTILGGVWTMQYQRRGVHLGLLAVGVSFIINVALTFAFSEITAAGIGGVGGAVISSLIGSGICGLLVAVPLLVSDNGLDDSSLFTR
jgi:hypothetical protein